MASEIERKFLVTDETWRQDAVGTPYAQGYLSLDPQRIVRIRRAGEKAFLTIKGLTIGVTRAEFEYPIPLPDAEAMFALCLGPLIEKTRYIVPWAGNRWEVDEFHGDNAGLIIAELELASEDESFEKPPWLGLEVSDDLRYGNSRLVEHPFRSWT